MQLATYFPSMGNGCFNWSHSSCFCIPLSLCLICKLLSVCLICKSLSLSCDLRISFPAWAMGASNGPTPAVFACHFHFVLFVNNSHFLAIGKFLSQLGQWVLQLVTLQLLCGEREHYRWVLVLGLVKICTTKKGNLPGAMNNSNLDKRWHFQNSFSPQICESNALSPYWPTNGIQCNPYLDWLEVRVKGTSSQASKLC